MWSNCVHTVSRVQCALSCVHIIVLGVKCVVKLCAHCVGSAHVVKLYIRSAVCCQAVHTRKVCGMSAHCGESRYSM